MKMPKFYFVEYLREMARTKVVKLPNPIRKINFLDCFITYLLFFCALVPAKDIYKTDDWGWF